MTRVVVRKGNTPEEKEANFQDAMKKFKRFVNKDGVLQEVKKREYFVKPGLQKRLKREAAERARMKKTKRF